jgi:hypothetical protein
LECLASTLQAGRKEADDDEAWRKATPEIRRPTKNAR